MNDDKVFERDLWSDLSAGETALTLKEAARLPSLRRDGRALNLCTLHRYCEHGARPGGGGDRIILEHFKQGSGRCTTRSAVLRFLRALSNAPPRPKASAAEAARAHLAAEKRLTACGL